MRCVELWARTVHDPLDDAHRDQPAEHEHQEDHLQQKSWVVLVVAIKA